MTQQTDWHTSRKTQAQQAIWALLGSRGLAQRDAMCDKFDQTTSTRNALSDLCETSGRVAQTASVRVVADVTRHAPAAS